MCGIVGITTKKSNVCLSLYNALTVLQHRGQDAAGMAVASDDGIFKNHKDNGLVRDVFSDQVMPGLAGNIGIGHVRYPTSGSIKTSEAQPFYVNSPYGISLVHNGNLVNTEALYSEIVSQNKRHINTLSDSELLLNVFANCLEKQSVNRKLSSQVIADAIFDLHSRIEGAYAVIAMIIGYGIVAFRDPNGIRPLVFGNKNNNQYIIASESVAIDCLGFELNRDVKPGEVIVIDNQNNCDVFEYNSDKTNLSPCIFEYVYLARPDSIIDGVNVYKSRLSMGRFLAKKIKQELSSKELDGIDVIIPIPDTSRTSALPLSIELNKKLREGFVKNRYIGRTFIMPGQKVRKKSVKQKLNTINMEFFDKNVLLVDDSIVRGNTSRQIIQMARDAGAKKVYFASASPPIRFPNVYGIDMPFVEELVAYGKKVEQICDDIGADRLIYQNLADLESAVKENNPKISNFDSSCFSGEYITRSVDSKYLSKLKETRIKGR